MFSLKTHLDKGSKVHINSNQISDNLSTSKKSLIKYFEKDKFLQKKEINTNLEFFDNVKKNDNLILDNKINFNNDLNEEKEFL